MYVLVLKSHWTQRHHSNCAPQEWENHVFVTLDIPNLLLTTKCPKLACILFKNYIYSSDRNKIIFFWGFCYVSVSRRVLGPTFWNPSSPELTAKLRERFPLGWMRAKDRAGRETVQTEWHVRRMEVKKRIYRPKKKKNSEQREFPRALYEVVGFLNLKKPKTFKSSVLVF